MIRRLLFFVFLTASFIGLGSSIFALEKVKLGSSVKVVPHYYLPPLAAEEKGFWQQNGLEVEWIPFTNAPAQMRAMAAGELNIGESGIDGPPTAAARGLPVIIVSELASTPAPGIWVIADSPYRHVRDLEGARVGVSALGGYLHTLARIIVSAHGVEKKVRFVGSGGIRESQAALRAGALDAVVTNLTVVAPLKLEGKVREVASVGDYLPKPWVDQVVFARKDFARGKPDVLRKTLKAMLQSFAFIRENPRWAVDKMKSFTGLSEEAAKLIYEALHFSVTGKLDRNAMENVRTTFIKYGILTEKAPAVDDLFTTDYLP